MPIEEKANEPVYKSIQTLKNWNSFTCEAPSIPVQLKKVMKQV